MLHEAIVHQCIKEVWSFYCVVILLIILISYLKRRDAQWMICVKMLSVSAVS